MNETMQELAVKAVDDAAKAVATAEDEVGTADKALTEANARAAKARREYCRIIREARSYGRQVADPLGLVDKAKGNEPDAKAVPTGKPND